MEHSEKLKDLQQKYLQCSTLDYWLRYRLLVYCIKLLWCNQYFYESWMMENYFHCITCSLKIRNWPVLFWRMEEIWLSFTQLAIVNSPEMWLVLFLIKLFHLGPGGQSSFLQKRMAKNTKYFDSGDYQVNHQNNLL